MVQFDTFLVSCYFKYLNLEVYEVRLGSLISAEVVGMVSTEPRSHRTLEEWKCSVKQ